MKQKWIITILWACLLLMAAAPAVHAKRSVNGTVFLDANGNGIMDKGEKGIPGVAVSNQYEIVVTDAHGNYRLPQHKRAIFYVIKPAAYRLPLDRCNLPRFYYIHQPEGSPKTLKYKGIEPTGKCPKRIDFPLLEGTVQKEFKVVVVGDPQTQTLEELGFYRDQMIPHLMREKADFYVPVGDILYDDLDLFQPMNEVTRHLGIPCHMVPGNHDMNFQVPDHRHQHDTYKRFYGPDYYSYNYGDVHFVVLNSIKYLGWDQANNKKGSYSGWVGEEQLEWLKKDLALVPEEHLVVVFTHAPIDTELLDGPHACIQNREPLIDILKQRRHVVALSGHTHYFEYMELPFPSMSVGSGCGTWWHGPKNADGLPFTLATGGAPNGYFLFQFKGNTFDFGFRAAGYDASHQLRINRPRGTIAQEETAQIRVNVNVFAGTPQTTVTYRLNGGNAVTMTRCVIKDPYFDALLKNNASLYKNWMQAIPSSHVWEAPLPGELNPGVHRLEVTAQDQYGHVFSGYRVFEVK